MDKCFITLIALTSLAVAATSVYAVIVALKRFSREVLQLEILPKKQNLDQ